MVKTGPGKSEREIREAIHRILREKERNFNALLRLLRQSAVLGSPNILSRHLKVMQQDGEVFAFTQPGPGIPRRIYYLAEKLPAKYGIEVASRTGGTDLEEFWMRNPALAPICITLGGVIHISEIEPENVQSTLPALYDHTGLISSMFAVIHCYREITGQEPPKESIEEWVKAYDDLWGIAVRTQAQEFKSATSEGRKPDYLTAVIKQLEQKHRIELPETTDPWDWVVQRLKLPDNPDLVKLKTMLRKMSQELEAARQSRESGQQTTGGKRTGKRSSRTTISPKKPNYSAR
jgi:hypothetical protein